MKIKLKSITYLLMILFIISCYFLALKNDSIDDLNKCIVKKISLKGRIEKIISTKSGYTKVKVDNYPDVLQIVYGTIVSNRGYTEGHTFDIGDSIIKKENSKEVLIKKDENFCIFDISCDD
ncbi:hypothetical protein AR687_17085 [Flavobacteriaceae bacterium CRH]|nr:hypothetical protein AR687_17085 [Flavobacteriaceae bacterium CRH]